MDLKTYISGERGTATKLASALGVPLSYLSQMINGTSSVSPKRCVEIEQVTNGVVTRKDLRPDDWADIWPELRSEQPAAA